MIKIYIDNRNFILLIVRIVIVLLFCLFINFKGNMTRLLYSQNKNSDVNSDVIRHIRIAESFVKQKTVDTLEKAIKEYEVALNVAPDNYEALWKISEVYIYLMDIKTNGLVVEKDSCKEILKKLGKPAYEYSIKAYEINPQGKEAIIVNLASYGYYISSFGIVKAVLKGTAGHYKDLAKKLIEVDDKCVGALGYRCLGRLYYSAPWPVGNTKKALKYFKKASTIASSMLEPHYWLGMLYLREKKYDLARKEFEFVSNNPPSEIETHYIKEFKKKAEKFLKELDVQ